MKDGDKVRITITIEATLAAGRDIHPLEISTAMLSDEAYSLKSIVELGDLQLHLDNVGIESESRIPPFVC